MPTSPWRHGRRTTSRVLLVATALAAVPAGAAHAAASADAAAPAASARAAATPGVQSRVFRISIKGTQTTEWEQHHAPVGRCDQSSDGVGRETATFRTRKPVRMQVQRFGGANSVLFGGAKGNALAAKGKVDRTADILLGDFDPLCKGTGGGGTSAPDCGARDANLQLRLSFVPSRRHGGIWMQGDFFTLYQNCPLLGTGFPEILTDNTNGKPVTAKIPAADLFDRSIGKHIVIARGERTAKDAETEWTTRVRWEITLRPVT